MRKLLALLSSIALVIGALVLFVLADACMTRVKEVYRSPSAEESKPIFLKNWGLSNTLNPADPSHINVACAWRESVPVRTITVAVIDTGIDPHHPDLEGRVWCDPAVKNECQYGWDFVSDKPNPTDENGHGTHVAGIIAAKQDRKTGVSGVAGAVRIMAIKYYSDSNPGSVNLRNTVRALNYAITHGAQVINYSGGGPEPSEAEYLELRKALAKGIVVVTAAGNEHQNTDIPENKYYPAVYRMDNMISVAATDILNHLLASSNWGKIRVDVAAPGDNIYSTLPGGRFGYMSGTSQATAFVSGLAAMILAEHPKADYKFVIDEIKKGVAKKNWLAGKLVSGGRIDACSTLRSARLDIKKIP